MSQIAIQPTERGVRIQRMRRELDPAAAHLDDETRRDDPNWRHGHMERSTKEIWIHSTDPSAMTKMFVLFPQYAAQFLIAGSHRLATEEEIAAHQAETKRQQIEARKRREEEIAPGREHTADAIKQMSSAVSSAVTTALQASRGNKAN